jgi:hypothetical protein
MNVHGVVGPSLPVPLSAPVHASSGAGVPGPAADSAALAGSPADSGRDAHLPGAHHLAGPPAAKHPEPPKPEPLPPLKGLTLAEIRAMLGVSLPLGGSGARTATAASPAAAPVPSLQSALSKYA